MENVVTKIMLPSGAGWRELAVRDAERASGEFVTVFCKRVAPIGTPAREAERNRIGARLRDLQKLVYVRERGLELGVRTCVVNDVLTGELRVVS